MRWPFGPPHLTLKPSKKNKKNNKKTKKNKQKTTQKETKTKKEKVKNTKIPKKRAFQLSVKIFFLFDRVSKNCLFDTLAQKTRTQKDYKNRGFSLFFWKEVMRHETAIFGQKNQIQKFQLSFFVLPFFFFKNKKQKSAETPIFIVFQQT